MKKERILKSSYKKAIIEESLFKTENLETYSFINKATLPKKFCYELYKVWIGLDIYVEHPWKIAYIRKITQPVHA